MPADEDATGPLLVPSALDIDVEAVLEEYAREGYARLGRVLSDEGMALLRARSDDLMLGRLVHEGLFFQRDTETGRYDDLEFKKGFEGPTLNYRKIEKLERDPLFRAWIENPLFERIARARIGQDVVIYRTVLFNKARRGGTVLPWHQDGGVFWGLDRDPDLQIWTALDDTPQEAGCVEVLPRSHGGLATRLGGMIPRNIVEDARAEERAVPVPTKAGEALLIHNHLWHRSLVNTTDAPRRALSVCYMPAETRCLRRKRAPRTFVRVFERS